jgi:uncharacterized membrane protein (UPF0182 family)
MRIVFGIFLGLNIILLILPPVVQRFWVAPNELVKETPYLIKHIKATRQAYGLDEMEITQLEGNNILSGEDIRNNEITIKNVRLWDNEPLLSTFSQIQEIRTYYEFNTVTNDRYMIDGVLRQVMLSPREMDSTSLPTQNWINSHLTFTHGYGLTAGPVNKVTSEGLPVLYVQDLPPSSTVEALEIERPEVYYGRSSNEYVLVKTKAKEFDYSNGDMQIYTEYEGEGGVVLDNLWKRIIYAAKFGSINIVLNSDIRKDSRILYYRQFEERVRKIAPFLEFDSDPYIVIADGKLYWMWDGYTSSRWYPYAMPVGFNDKRINYIRNSAKVVVDVYNGEVTFYRTQTDDPLADVLANIFPDLFTDYTQMPDSLKEHIRYPEDLFEVQANAYATYHMGLPQTFYNREDQWEIPEVSPESAVSNARLRFSPRHTVMKLPEMDSEEYILMLPFTPRDKDNLSAWMVARNDGENYGKLKVYTFPKDKLVYGPRQVMGRINQDSEVSKQFTLWDQRGSEVIQGPLVIIPIETSLLYVRPVYMKASDGKIPELKRVIVAYENRIAMSETLEGALNKLFGALEETTTGESVDVVAEEESFDPLRDSLIERANRLYEQAVESQENGDWSSYGDKIEQLGEVLLQLQ